MRRDHQPGRRRDQHRRGEGRRPGRGDLGRALIDDLARAAARELEERYGLRYPELGARLEGGYANDLFVVRAGAREWVLRLELPPVDEAALAWEHSATRQLAQRLQEVCAPAVARDGTTWFPAGETVAWLMPLLPGASADPARSEDRDAAAAALGRLHAAGAGLDLPPHPRLQPLPRMQWPPAAAPRALAEWASEIAEMRAWATAAVRRLAAERRPRVGFIHGDFFPGNVLVASGETTGIIDWEEAHTDWLSWDLANALGTFCFGGDELDRAAARRFLTAYRGAGGTAPRAEEDMLVPLMRVKRILEVLRAPTDREPRWQHQRHNLRALRHLASTSFP